MKSSTATTLNFHVTREKAYAWPGCNWKYAWKWIYTVACPEVREDLAPDDHRTLTYQASCDTLSEVKNAAQSVSRRHGARPVITYAWKEVPQAALS